MQKDYRLVEGLRLTQFSKTNYAILFETKEGLKFWLAGDKYSGEALAQQDEIPVISCQELQQVLEKADRTKTIELLKPILALKSAFNAKVVPETKRS